MSQIHIMAEKEFWYLSTPDLHYGYVVEGECLTSGQEYIETYETEQEWLDALTEHGIDPNEEEIT